jgi:lipopolysaccharide export system protein LptA
MRELTISVRYTVPRMPPLKISRLRFWFVVGAMLITAIVAGAYFYARWRVENALKEVPGRIGFDVQQSANGFTISKSEGGRTLFKIQASNAVKYKLGGRTELHNVNITVYGQDSTRFDQIYGDDFAYDPQTGDVTAQGEVQIDLEANSAGVTNPDQAAPKELKNPIHLKTSGLVFNQKTGNAWTQNKVEFEIPQASGSAVGANYAAKTGVLTLESRVEIAFNGANAAKLTAQSASVSKKPRAIVFEKPDAKTSSGQVHAGKATLFLDANNKLDRVLMAGDVSFQASGKQQGQARAAQLELLLANSGNALRRAIFSGGVHVEASEPQTVGDAEKVVAVFGEKNALLSVHSEGNVKLVQEQKASGTSGPQEFEVNAPAIDFMVTESRRLSKVETSGPPQISIHSATGGNRQQTVATAGKFVASFNSLGQLTSLHGAPDARIVMSQPGQADRVGTSSVLDVHFRAENGIESIVQQGQFAYTDGERKAWSDRATYTTADQMLVLAGSPRVASGGMMTTATSMRLNRANNDAVAQGNVKTTYSDLKEQPSGALLASSSPIHVTAQNMTAHSLPSVASYSGDVRLWQDTNIVRAPNIDFNRDRRQIIAHGSAEQPVSTTLVQSNSEGKVTPVAITCAQLSYDDAERKIHLDGGVTAKGADVSMTSDHMEVLLQARTGNVADQNASPAGKIEKIVAQGDVVVNELDRKATGGQLTYTSADDKFVMAGNSPSIFDAEHGKITGVSLTFFRHDDRVLVEGNNQSPSVTRARVAR